MEKRTRLQRRALLKVDSTLSRRGTDTSTIVRVSSSGPSCQQVSQAIVGLVIPGLMMVCRHELDSGTRATPLSSPTPHTSSPVQYYIHTCMQCYPIPSFPSYYRTDTNTTAWWHVGTLANYYTHMAGGGHVVYSVIWQKFGVAWALLAKDVLQMEGGTCTRCLGQPVG